VHETFVGFRMSAFETTYTLTKGKATKAAELLIGNFDLD
jgi:hypothetical protein